MSNEAIADTTDANTETIDGFIAARDDLIASRDAALAARDEWAKSKSIRKGSDLATYVDEVLSAWLDKRVTETERDVTRITTQIERQRIADENRELQARIAENAQKLKALADNTKSRSA